MADISQFFKSDPHDQKAFLSFCEKQGNKEYVYIFNDKCAYAQYLRSIAHYPETISVNSDTIYVRRKDNEDATDDIEYNLQDDLVRFPRTFAALAERIRKRHDREYAISAESMHWIPTN